LKVVVVGAVVVLVIVDVVVVVGEVVLVVVVVVEKFVVVMEVVVMVQSNMGQVVVLISVVGCGVVGAGGRVGYIGFCVCGGGFVALGASGFLDVVTSAVVVVVVCRGVCEVSG
jgi:hypothetical protein